MKPIRLLALVAAALWPLHACGGKPSVPPEGGAHEEADAPRATPSQASPPQAAMIGEIPAAVVQAPAGAEAPPAEIRTPLSAAPLEASRSQIEFETMTEDLGDSYQENEYPVGFPFMVRGPDPAKVTALQISCGCTDAHVEVGGERWPLEKPIPPDTPAAVKATFKAPIMHGRKISTIEVRGNAANLPLRLTIQAMVKPFFELVPSRVSFGEVAAASLKANCPSFDVQVVAPEAFQIARWAYVPPGIIVEDTARTETGPDGKSFARWLKVALDPAARPGRYVQSVMGETSLGRNLEIPVLGEVVGLVKYFPESFVRFGLVNQGHEVTRKIKVVAGGAAVTLPQPVLEMAPAAPADAVFSAGFGAVQMGREYEVLVTIQPGASVGNHKATLRLTYPPDSGIEAKEFPVSAVVRALQ